MIAKNLTVLAFLACVSTQAATVTLADNFESLNPASNWTSVTNFNDNSGSHTTNYLLTTGNPNQWAQTTHNLPNAGSQYEAGYLFNTTYTPSSAGAIQFVQFSIDTIRQTTPGVLYIRPLIFQNSIVHVGASIGLGTSWATQTTGFLTAANFSQAFNPSVHPDFSATGSVLQVGYLVGSNNYTGTTNGPIAGVDDFSATLTTATPEPGTWSMMGLALVIAGAIRRVRVKA